MLDINYDNEKLFNFCKAIPKIELHAHLNGSIRKETLFELLNEENKEKLKDLYKQNLSFLTCFNIFKISSKIITNLDVIKRITNEMMEDWVENNCIYLEIRTSVKRIGDCTKEDYLKTVLLAIEEGNKKYKMRTRLLISLSRELEMEDFIETYNIYSRLDNNLKSLVVGLDYSGNALIEKHMYKDLIPIFQMFQKEGLKVTVHLGETEQYQLMDFNLFKPDRVAHTFFYTKEECEEVIKHNIPIEICPSSSFYVKEVKNFNEIPFAYYKDYNKFCINTDDTMLFDTNLSKEYYLLMKYFNINQSQLKEVLLNSCDFIFDKSVISDIKKEIQSFNFI